MTEITFNDDFEMKVEKVFFFSFWSQNYDEQLTVC